MNIVDLFARCRAHVVVKTTDGQGVGHSYAPVLVKGQLIQAANTGRYVQRSMQVPFNAVIRGTIAPNAPMAANGVVLDFQQHVIGTSQVGTITAGGIRATPLITDFSWRIG